MTQSKAAHRRERQQQQLSRGKLPCEIPGLGCRPDQCSFHQNHPDQVDIDQGRICNEHLADQNRRLYAPKPRSGWGGKRAGAGAPTANLNRLTHGARSKLLKKGITKMAEEPVMRAVLLIIARLATQGEVPPSTKKLIQKLTKGVK